jgi:hypothetical protein
VDWKETDAWRRADIRYEVFPDLEGASAIYQMPTISSIHQVGIEYIHMISRGLPGEVDIMRNTHRCRGAKSKGRRWKGKRRIRTDL